MLCAATLAFFWPGVAMYDSVAQYGQVLSGAYDDWHPPVMARLWALIHHAWAGQAPMFALQILLYWVGLGLLAAALARRGACLAAIAALALGLWPPFAGWEVAVLKDGQMAGALLAATGLASWWRLDGRRLPYWAAALVALLLVYATLLRFNAMFATVPLAIGLFGGARWHRPVPRVAAILVGFALVVALGPAINHSLLGATPSGIERALPIYDLAGIARHAGPEAVPVLPAQVWREAEKRRCITPLLWDPLADSDHCGFVSDGLDETAPGRMLFAAWGGAVLHHPFAYAAHRLAHWNSTMRFWVPWHMPFAEPQWTSEPNTFGLGSPSRRIEPFQKLAGWLTQGPFGSPMLWFSGALAILTLARPSAGPRHQLANTLALSAVATELGFLLVSIASDIRYHLWAMLAAGLAGLLLVGTPLPRRRAQAALAAMLLVLGTCLLARAILPAVGDTYAAALGPNG
ncbi:hypothetical protein [Sphingomonas sp. JC676]|uniref:hypothetical protein n=1 Tax=Sphingomonas sp. JC676 TaxID=2768065 RepID=UPI00223B15D8|nr:hypothetical protein [Sphingomonas sp. JC676]